MMGRRIVAGIGANVFDRVVGAVVQLVLVPVFAIHWGVALYGSWILLATIPTVLALSDLGFSGAASFRINTLASRGEHDKAEAVLHSAWKVVLQMSLVLAVVGGAAVLLVPDRFLPDTANFPASDVRLTASLLLAYTLIMLQGTTLQAMFRATQRFAHGTLAFTLTVLLENMLAVSVVVLGYGPVAAAAALLIGRATCVAIQALYLHRTTHWLRLGIAKATVDERRLLQGPAIAAIAINVGFAFVLQGSVLALGAVAGAAAVPAFTATRTLSRIGIQLAQMPTTPLMPEFASVVAKNDRPTIEAMLLIVLATSFAIALVFGLGLALFGTWLVEVWTRGQITASPALTIAMGGSAFFGILWNPMGNMILALNRHAAISYSYLTLGIMSLVGVYLTGSIWGAEAAAVAFLMLDAAMVLIVFRFAHREWFSNADWPSALALLHQRGLRFLRLRKDSPDA